MRRRSLTGSLIARRANGGLRFANPPYGPRKRPASGRDSPATTNGTLNDVGDIPGTPFDRDNFVKSFVLPPQDFTKTTEIVVNYTVAGEHALHEGFVMRYGILGPDGTVTAWRSYGEGNAWQQHPGLKGIWGPQVQNVWTQNHREIIAGALGK